MAHRFWDLPGTTRFRETRFFPRPSEPERIFPSWLETYAEERVTAESLEDARRVLPHFVELVKRYHGKPRFLTKMVGRPVKTAILAAVFPDALFVHVTRDLFPTVSSLMRVEFYDPSSGLDPWPWGTIPHDYREYYEHTGRTPEVAAAIKVRLNRIEQERQLSTLNPSQRLEVPYADFVAAPEEGIRTIAQAARLPLSPTFLRRMKHWNVYGGADAQWRKHFDADQVRRLEGFAELPERDPAAPQG